MGVHQDAVGIHAIAKLENGRSARIVLTEPHLRLDSEPTLRDVSEALIAVYGTDYGTHSPTSISRFTDMARQAANYRDRRVLLAGEQSPGSFLTALLDLTVERSRKISCCFPKGTVPLFLLET